MPAKRLYLDYRALNNAVNELERVRGSCNNYGLKTNLEKVVSYLKRIKLVIETQKANDYSKSITEMSTLDEWINNK